MLIVEYERFKEDKIDVMSIVDEETDTVVAMFQDEELQEVLEKLVQMHVEEKPKMRIPFDAIEFTSEDAKKLYEDWMKGNERSSMKQTFIVGIETDCKDFNEWIKEHDKQIRAEVNMGIAKKITDFQEYCEKLQSCKECKYRNRKEPCAECFIEELLEQLKENR